MVLATPCVNLLKSWIFSFSLHLLELGRRAQLTKLIYEKEGLKKSSVYLVCWLKKAERLQTFFLNETISQ